MSEIWRDIDGWQYQVSNQGRVRRVGGRLNQDSLNTWETGRGYLRVFLIQKPRRYSPAIHTLVAAAFIGPKLPGMEVNHKDGNKHNNRASNLEYLSCKENIAHAFRTGLRAIGEDAVQAKLSEEQALSILSTYKCGSRRFGASALGSKFGVNATTITRIVSGQGWKHLTGGKQWTVKTAIA